MLHRFALSLLLMAATSVASAGPGREAFDAFLDGLLADPLGGN